MLVARFFLLAAALVGHDVVAVAVVVGGALVVAAAAHALGFLVDVVAAAAVASAEFDAVDAAPHAGRATVVLAAACDESCGAHHLVVVVVAADIAVAAAAAVALGIAIATVMLAVTLGLVLLHLHHPVARVAGTAARQAMATYLVDPSVADARQAHHRAQDHTVPPEHPLLDHLRSYG